jgi:hypothetical protein
MNEEAMAHWGLSRRNKQTMELVEPFVGNKILFTE